MRGTFVKEIHTKKTKLFFVVIFFSFYETILVVVFFFQTTNKTFDKTLFTKARNE